jgi:hypothetical protein
LLTVAGSTGVQVCTAGCGTDFWAWRARSIQKIYHRT